MSLWVPPGVSRELQDETERDRAELLGRAKQRHVVNLFNPDLKRVDPYLEMVWFDEDVDLPGVTGGRYHLLRHIPGAPPQVIPITDPQGGYMEPNSGLFEWLGRGDMWRGDARYERERAAREAERAADRQRERERAEHVEELRDRWNANFRASVSMNTSVPWSQNSRGRLPGKKAA